MSNKLNTLELEKEVYQLITSKQKQHYIKNIYIFKSESDTFLLTSKLNKLLYSVNFKLIPTLEKVKALTEKNEEMQNNLQKYLKNLNFLSELQVIISKEIYKHNKLAKQLKYVCSTYVRNADIIKLQKILSELRSMNKSFDRKEKYTMREKGTYKPFILVNGKLKVRT